MQTSWLAASTDPEAMKRILADPTIVRGTKVRLWCLTIPLPGITPLVVAAIPIRDNMTADELLGPLETILYGLLERNLRVISYACDGTETERLLQRKLVEKAEKVIHHKILNPTAGAPELESIIAFFRGYPVVMIQDAKHALKTFRNNLFTGAKYFAMGNFTAIFRRILQIAMAPGSPLYRRDAVKLDRQDDAAACRLFCADVLKYLFIFGELVDAYQSREISHAERIKLALRARYFLDAWSKYLDVAGYKEATVLPLPGGRIISLIIVHRDHVPVIPLLPWYHSSEPCEHTFGNPRDIVKDFTFLDFIFMAAKLRITMREAVLSGKTSGGKAPAQGYTHTYFDTIGADLTKLAVYPSDAEIAQASAEAAAECYLLIALLGITPGQLYEGVPAQLPGIRSWFPDDEDDVIDDLVEPAEEFDDIEEQMGEAEELPALIDAEERLDAPLRSAKTDRELMSLTCASIALSLDEHMRIQEFQRVNEDLEEEILGDEYMTIKETLASIPVALPSLQLPSEASTPVASTAFDTLDFKALVRQRRQHQTRQAAKSARVKIHHGDDDDSAPTAPILRKYHELLKEDQSKATGTAVERQARWTTDPKPAGNAVNAAAAATAATRAATRRAKLFKEAKVPSRLLAVVKDAAVTHFKPLTIGDYGIVWTEAGLRVGLVDALYSKGGGKAGKHGDVAQHHNISAFSFINVKVFELSHARNFRAYPTATSYLDTYQFRQLPPFNFICRLSEAPTVNPAGIELSRCCVIPGPQFGSGVFQ
ncbi:hypothetical protein C8R46DRAFT_1174476 [Mycena filopes]|nr:hypothetical protein C8R46DRAFT_1174476 [Mycena filopes]